MHSTLTPELKCYICGSGAISIKQVVEMYPVLLCADCGLLWVDDIDEQQIVDFYNGEYFKSEDSIIGYSDYLADEPLHRKNAASIIGKARKYINNPAPAALDVGCAYGFLMDEAKKQGQETIGLELNQDAYLYATQKLALRVFNKDLLSSGFDEGSFDMVYVIGTIEHVMDPARCLQEVNRILKKDGIVVITTMDTKGALPFYSLKPPEHLFYFSHDNLNKLLAKTGFHTEKVSLHFSYYRIKDVFYRLEQFANNKKIPALPFVFGQIGKLLVDITLKIPTNEMLVIARKNKGNGVDANFV